MIDRVDRTGRRFTAGLRSLFHLLHFFSGPRSHSLIVFWLSVSVFSSELLVCRSCVSEALFHSSICFAFSPSPSSFPSFYLGRTHLWRYVRSSLCLSVDGLWTDVAFWLLLHTTSSAKPVEFTHQKEHLNIFADYKPSFALVNSCDPSRFEYFWLILKIVRRRAAWSISTRLALKRWKNSCHRERKS